MGEATRQTFDGLSTSGKVLWYSLAWISTGIFLYGVWRIAQRVRQGRPAGSRPRVGHALHIVFTHTWIRRRDGVAGLAHAGVFYGFLVLFAGTVILSFQDHVAGPLGWHFWQGWFYQGYSLFLDVFGVALVLGLCVFAYRRFSHLARLDYGRVDGVAVSPARGRYASGDRLFLLLLFFLALSGFLLEALRIAADHPGFEKWSPVGWIAGNGLRSLGLAGDTANSARHVTWWIHGVVALAFVAAVPFTKAVHMLAGPAGVAVRDDAVGQRLPAEPETGYAALGDFDRRHLMDVEACTKCGKCHAACPAAASGFPLSPRDLVLDLREASHAGTALAIKPDTLWSCMQCMACVEICPVGIEHVPIINLLRRGLVEKGEMDSMLQSTLEAVYTSGNSFGEQKRKRARWARELEVELKDARKEPVDLLWWVGDYASLDPRNQRNTQALARILQQAGVDVGIVYDAEKTAGNDVRRAGEEGLFRSLAEENIATIAGCDFARILTSDPHTFNTFRNEYPGLGAPWTSEQVVHHSQLLLELLEGGAVPVVQPLGRRITYHDPCTLGRYNGIFEEPRELMRRIGLELVEMPRNRSNSFCCGAGGGRIWMKDLSQPGSRRPSEQRIDEAVSLGALDYFVCACPKDVTMYEDAIKTSGHGEQIALRELSELVAEAAGIEL